MCSSAEISLLIKITQISERFGLRPSDTEARVVFVDDRVAPDGVGYYGIDFVGAPADREMANRYSAFAKALGIEQCQVRATYLSGLEDIVDRALTIAPRARHR